MIHERISFRLAIIGFYNVILLVLFEASLIVQCPSTPCTVLVIFISLYCWLALSHIPRSTFFFSDHLYSIFSWPNLIFSYASKYCTMYINKLTIRWSYTMAITISFIWLSYKDVLFMREWRSGRESGIENRALRSGAAEPRSATGSHCDGCWRGIAGRAQPNTLSTKQKQTLGNCTRETVFSYVVWVWATYSAKGTLVYVAAHSFESHRPLHTACGNTDQSSRLHLGSGRRVPASLQAFDTIQFLAFADAILYSNIILVLVLFDCHYKETACIYVITECKEW